ncbi:MAG: acyl-ACP thioesterase domain-containing protein [Bacteroidota bacterium]
MKETWKAEYRVMAHHTGEQQRCRLKACLDFAQDAAGDHAAHLGVGYEDLRQQKAFWALSRMAVRVERIPVWNDRVYVETWPSAYDRIFAYRVIHLKNQDNETLMVINTAWLVMHLEKRRFLSVKPFVEKLPTLGDRGLELPTVDKLKGSEEARTSSNYSPVYSDLDSNLHVNNTSYIGWIDDAYPLRWHTKCAIQELQINYLQESFAGDELTLNQYELSVLDHLWEIKKGDEIITRLLTKWR